MAIRFISRAFPEKVVAFLQQVLVRCRGHNVIATVPGMELPRDLEIGPKLAACTAQERLFVWFYVTGDGEPKKSENATEAARAAGYVDNDNGAIRVRGHALLHRERVIEAIEEVGRRAFRSLLVPALNKTRALILNDKHPDHARTLQATLSRLGLVERTAVDVNHQGEVTVNHTDAALHDLKMLRALKVPRESLIELFGYSGLSRYEKMLADQERRALPAPGPIIEHEPTNG